MHARGSYLDIAMFVIYLVFSTSAMTWQTDHIYKNAVDGFGQPVLSHQQGVNSRREECVINRQSMSIEVDHQANLLRAIYVRQGLPVNIPLSFCLFQSATSSIR